jgi:hypothetical protein
MFLCNLNITPGLCEKLYQRVRIVKPEIEASQLVLLALAGGIASSGEDERITAVC